MLGFLRTEGADYDRVMTVAGRLAGEWTVASLSPFQRRMVGSMPRPFRKRAALRIAAGIIRDVSSASRTTIRVSRQSARVVVKGSLFCEVREPQPAPLCAFYLGVVAETLTRMSLPARGRVEGCRAVGGDACVIALELSRAGVADPAVAA